MVNLYIASLEPAGKTAVCASIGRKMIAKGKKVGFFIPVHISENSEMDGYKDVTFMKETLGLQDSPEKIAPFSLSVQELWEGLTDDSGEFIQQVKKACASIAKGKDVVIMKGLSGVSTDNVSTLACYKFVESMNAKAILVMRYSANLNPSKIARVVDELGKRLLGIIISFVPESKLNIIRKSMTALFSEAGVNVLGVFPEVRTLLGMTVNELAEALEGELLTCRENTGELVENVMAGAMTIDSGIDYFSRKANKAVIVSGERSDMQMAALETATRCLVLTNNIRPIDAVIYQAQNKNIPVMMVKKDTAGTIADVERALTRSSFNSPQKLKKFEEIIDKDLDFGAIYSALGLGT